MIDEVAVGQAESEFEPTILAFCCNWSQYTPETMDDKAIVESLSQFA